METHHGASNHFGHQDFYAAQRQGKSITEIANWFRSNPNSHVHGLNSKVYQDIKREESQYLAQQAQQQALAAQQGNMQYGTEGQAPGEGEGATGVKMPSIKKPDVPTGNVSPHDFANDYMNKIMNARNNGQDPLRYDKKAQGQDNTTMAQSTNQDMSKSDSPYDANRYKDTQFNYDKDATRYQSPQYTG